MAGANWLLVLTLAFLLLLSPCIGFLVNATIDDAFPDPRTGERISYSPPAAWNDGRDPCPGCTARPSPLDLFNGTWHDSTFNSQPGSNDFPNVPLLASVQFNGVAVYVYCALARTTASPSGNSDMTFFIDGRQVGSFTLAPPGTLGYDYDVIVYQNTSIPPGEHELMLQNGRVNGPKSLMLLDRIVYTYENGQKSEGRKNQELGAIIGGTLGGVAFLCMVAVGLGYYCMKRRRTSKAAAATGLEAIPYHLAPAHQQSVISGPSASGSAFKTLGSAAGSSTSGNTSRGHQRTLSHNTFDPNSLVRSPGTELPPDYDESTANQRIPSTVFRKQR